MGEYFDIVNLDRREFISPLGLGSDDKYLGVVLGALGPMTAMGLLARPGGRWHGDRIIVAGDQPQGREWPAWLEDRPLPYWLPFPDGDPDDPDYLPLDGQRFVDITDRARQAITDMGAATFVAEAWAAENGEFRRRAVPGWTPPESPCAWIVNHDKGQYLDPRAFGDGPQSLEFIATVEGGAMTALGILLTPQPALRS